MKYLPKGTIESYLSIPQTRTINLAQIHLKPAVVRIKEYWNEVSKNGDKASCEQDAVEFYCLNHLVSIIRQNFDQQEKLPAWALPIMELYVQSLAKQSKRLYVYMLLIISRESRHVKDPAKCAKAFSTAQYEFLQAIKGMGSEATAKYFCANTPDMPLGKYVEGCCKVFFEGKFGSSYGGPPWGNIAKCLHDMVTGKTSMEVMVDTAYTLAHNGGPMFNKGMLYAGFSSGSLLRILDIQRSGQIPEAILHGGIKGEAGTPTLDLKERIEAVQAVFPASFGSSVDWKKVASDHALGDYSYEISQMPKEPPKPVAPPAKGEWVKVGDLHVLPNKPAIAQFKRAS
jgi:hypothetical protein